MARWNSSALQWDETVSRRQCELRPRNFLLWAVLSLAWNLLSGYSGYFSFGHAAFWGLGAYTVALGMLYLDLTPWHHKSGEVDRSGCVSN